ELHASLEPAENLALRKEFRRGSSGIGEPREVNLVGLENGFDGVVIKRGPEIRVTHGLERKPLAAIEIRSESGAKSNAIIGCGWLNEKLIDNAGSEDFAVGLVIGGDAPGEAKTGAANFFLAGGDDANHRGNGKILNGEGD